MNHRPYPSDLTDAQWDILESLLPKDRPLGRPRKTDLRRVLDAILYRNRNGCTWRALPHDLPAWRTVYNYFMKWRDDGTAAPRVLEKLTQESFPRLKKLWGDTKYHNHGLNQWISRHGWYVIEVKSRPPGSEGFKVIKWRWVVEQTFAWLGRCRIHSRDYERKTSSSEAQIPISRIGLMLRRLAGEKHKAPFRYPRPQANVAA